MKTRLNIISIGFKSCLVSKGYMTVDYSDHRLGVQICSKLSSDDRNGALHIATQVVESRWGESVGGDIVTWAALRQEYGVIDVMIDAGASVDSVNTLGSSALEYVAIKYLFESAIELMRRGAQPSRKVERETRRTAFVSAVLNGDTKMATAMIEYGADLSDVTSLSDRTLYNLSGDILRLVVSAGGSVPDGLKAVLENGSAYGDP